MKKWNDFLYSKDTYVFVELTLKDKLVAIGLAIFAVFFYVLNLTPSISAGDNGELTTAMFYLGVAHAPGYPLHSLLGKLATFLPILNVAWRANFFSALCGGVTLFFAVLLYIRLLRATCLRDSYLYLSALVAALTFMLSDVFWGQSVICEVYTLSSIFFPLLLLVLLKWHDSLLQNTKGGAIYFGENYLLAFAFIFGVALSAHQTIILISFFTFVFVGYVLYQNVFRPQHKNLSTKEIYEGLLQLIFVAMLFGIAWIFYYFRIMSLKSNLYANNQINVKWGLGIFGGLNVVAIFFYCYCRFLATDLLKPNNPYQRMAFLIVKFFIFIYLGFAIHLYMIIRSHGSPPINWMGISEVEGFWPKLGKFFNALHRKQFGDGNKLPLSFFNFVTQIKLLIATIHASQYTLVFYGISVLGFVQLFKKLRFYFWKLVLMIASYNILLTLFLGFRFEPKHLFFVKVFYIFSYFCVSIAIAFGVAFLLELFEKRVFGFLKDFSRKPISKGSPSR